MLPALVALCLASAAVFLLWRPQYAIVAVIVMFPLEQVLQSYFMVFLVHQMLVNVLVGLTAGAGLVWRITRKQPIGLGYWSNRTIPMIWTLYALSWAGLLWSPSAAMGLHMMLPGLPLYILVLVFLPLLVFDLESFYRVELAILIVGTAICALVLVNPAASFYGTRLVISLGVYTGGERANPLALADLGGAIAVVAITYVARRAGLLVLGVRVAAIVLGLGLAVASGSRGQVVAALGVGLLFFPISRRLKNQKEFLLVLIGFFIMYQIVSFTLGQFIGDVNRDRWDSTSLSSGVDSRMELTMALFNAWIVSPIAWVIGLGTNAFSSLRNEPYVHNLFSEVLGEHGIIGASILAVAMLDTFRRSRFLVQLYSGDPPLRSAAATLGALSVYWLLIALKQGTFISSPQVFMFWFMTAKIAATEKIFLESDTESGWLEDLGEEEQEFLDDGLPADPAAPAIERSEVTATDAS